MIDVRLFTINILPGIIAGGSCGDNALTLALACRPLIVNSSFPLAFI